MLRARSTDAIHVNMIGAIEGLIRVQYNNVDFILRGSVVE